MSNRAWEAIFDFYTIHEHDFKTPFYISADEIRNATRQFKATRDREPRLICKHDTRESRPQLFQDKNLFLLPIKNGQYAILRGEGYVDIPPIDTAPEKYISQLDYELDTVKVGNSEMQHIDYAYAASLIRSVMDDDSLVLTIRGRKYTPAFKAKISGYNLNIKSISIDISSVYEGRNQVVIIQNVKPFITNLSIASIYFKYLMFQKLVKKNVRLTLIEKVLDEFGIWEMRETKLNKAIPVTLTPFGRRTII